MMPFPRAAPAVSDTIGTLIAESSSREFRLALAHESVREQDIIAVDADLRNVDADSPVERLRVWAKVQRIERINPLFPAEAGHELAQLEANAFDTVLSLSREMVTAVCSVLGAEPLEGNTAGKLDTLRYPPRPASRAYRPNSSDVSRIVLGDLSEKRDRGLDLGFLSSRHDVPALVDGHAVVTRHLAILAMTGAGKSVTARRIIEELAEKNYPIVIFDPHGDYTGLANVPALKGKVRRYYARFPLFDEESEDVANIVDSLAFELSDTMRTRFDDLFKAAQSFVHLVPVEERKFQKKQTDSERKKSETELKERQNWLAKTLQRPALAKKPLEPDMWLIAQLAEAGQNALQSNDDAVINFLQEAGWPGFASYTGTDIRTLEGIKKRCYRAAKALARMETTNQKVARDAIPLPTDRKELVQFGGISVISLAGYTGDFQATIYNLIAGGIFDLRVSGDLKLPVLLLLEEAHNFAPAKAFSPAEERATLTTRQIAQEGRKFGVGLILVSQRPSRLDATALSQCNSFIIMRMVNPADQQFVRNVVETLAEDEARMLPSLDVGEAILSGQFINFPVLVRIKKPVSEGEREERDAFEALHEAQALAMRAPR